jgi:hypothetical protein
MLFSRPYSYASNFNLRTGILITGCMACGGGRFTGLGDIKFYTERSRSQLSMANPQSNLD